MSSVLVALRRLAADRIPALGIALVILVTATVFALAPRILERVGDNAFRGVVREASAFDRNITIIEEQPIQPGSAADPLSGVDEEGDRLDRELPASIDNLIASRSTVIDSARWKLVAETADPTYVRFRIQPGAEARLHYVEGRAPTATVGSIDVPPQPPVPGNAPQLKAKVLEVALSADSVKPTGASLGDTILVKLDFRDPLVNGERNEFAAMKIVGIFAVDASIDPFWYDDRSLERVSYRTIGGDSLFVDVTALIATDSYESMVGLVQGDITPTRTMWRSFVDPDRLRASDLDPLARDLRKLDTIFPKGQALSRSLDAAALQSGLLPLVVTHQARWTSALAILMVLAIGPAAVALGTLLLIAVIAARRRRPALSLVRGRGGTVGQLIRAVLFEGAVLAIPTSALAIALATAAVPADRIQPTIAGAALVAAAAIVLLVFTGVSGLASASPAAHDAARDAGVPMRRSARRVVFDIVIVVAAATGAYLLRERGV